MDALLRQVEEEFNAPGGAQSPVASWLARAVVWKLAQAAANRQGGGDPRRYRHQALFARFLMLVEQNVLAHWTVGQYASRLGMTAARLNRLTCAEAGQPALELVHQRLTREALPAPGLHRGAGRHAGCRTRLRRPGLLLALFQATDRTDAPALAAGATGGVKPACASAGPTTASS